MPILDCTVETCYNNKNRQCCLNDIKVDGKEACVSEATACASFKDAGKDCYSNSCHCQSEPVSDIDVKCEATKCRYNCKEKCNADHIDIVGSKAKNYMDTECLSFYSGN